MSNPAVLQSLREISARLGGDPFLVQGPGGNSSQKIGDRLWVKASGYWLADAMEKAIFVPLSLDGVRARLKAGEAETLDEATIRDEAEPGLKPSIETALHALMPHAVVIHAHAVNSMTVAVLADGKARAAAALDAVAPWAWVEYRRPGAPLADAVARALAQGAPDVLLLENHGVVVGAETPQAAEVLLRAVERALALPLRALPKSGPAAPDDGAYAFIAEMSGLAFDPELTALLSAAPLVPDQVVFLGGGVPVCLGGETVEQAARRVWETLGVAPVLILAPGIGVFAARGRSKGAASLVDGLFEIARRIPAGARVRGLPPDAVAELMGWEAEHYRQALDRQRG